MCIRDSLVADILIDLMSLFADTKAPPILCRTPDGPGTQVLNTNTQKRGCRTGTRVTTKQPHRAFCSVRLYSLLTSLPRAGGEDGGAAPALFSKTVYQSAGRLSTPILADCVRRGAGGLRRLGLGGFGENPAGFLCKIPIDN